MTRARTIAACHKSANAPFDWDQHQRDLARKMAAFNEWRERDAEIGRQMVEATRAMTADVSAMLRGDA